MQLSPGLWKAWEKVALSTMEAEYQSASVCWREVVWLRKLWPQLGFPVEGLTQVYGDNKACLALCSPLQTTPTCKHIHIIYCWVPEKVEVNEIKIVYVASAEIVADLFTKALFKPAFEVQREKLELRYLELEQRMGGQQKALRRWITNKGGLWGDESDCTVGL